MEEAVRATAGFFQFWGFNLSPGVECWAPKGRGCDGGLGALLLEPRPPPTPHSGGRPPTKPTLRSEWTMAHACMRRCCMPVAGGGGAG